MPSSKTPPALHLAVCHTVTVSFQEDKEGDCLQALRGATNGTWLFCFTIHWSGLTPGAELKLPSSLVLRSPQLDLSGDLPTKAPENFSVIAIPVVFPSAGS